MAKIAGENDINNLNIKIWKQLRFFRMIVSVRLEYPGQVRILYFAFLMYALY